MRKRQNTKPKDAPQVEKAFMDVRLEALQAEMHKALETIAQHEAILRGLHETRLRIEGAILVLEELISAQLEKLKKEELQAKVLGNADKKIIPDSPES